MTTARINHESFAHIAPGPYRLIGVSTEEDREIDNTERNMNAVGTETVITNSCGGTCDHCGTAIFTVYKFVAADGTKFKVGCDCAEKALCGEENQNAARAVDKVKRAIDSKKRKALAARKHASNMEWLSTKLVELDELPSPNPNRATMGETAADWATWMMKNAGKSGVAKTRKIAGQILGDK